VSGARAATSHTGALAGRDSAIDALLAQCGVLRVDTVEELFDAAMAFSQLPRLTDDTVAVVTNAGGPGIIIADTCEAAGLHVAELSAETQKRLRRDLPEEASVRNPVDMIATATPANYRIALETVLADESVSSAIAAFVPPLGIRQLDVAGAIIDAHGKHPLKPLLAVLMGREGLPQGRAELSAAGVPAYIFPESAARALAALNRYRERLARRDGVVRTFDVDREGAASILEHGVAGADGQLGAPDALALLSAYGIPTVGSRLATSAEQAAGAAQEIGFPVVLKVVSPDIVHKTDAGGVALALRPAAEGRLSFGAIVDRAIAYAPGATIQGVLVEKHVHGGRETIIGMSQDSVFGPLLMFGLGGIYVEALADVVFRLQPVTDADARDMVASIHAHMLLEGVRGEPPSDIGLLVETIERVAQLAADHPSIEELDINPFVVFENGGCAVDARVKIG
jgi:acetyltransferase